MQENTYEFKLIVPEGNDEYWENKPTMIDIAKDLKIALESNGFLDVEVRPLKAVMYFDMDLENYGKPTNFTSE